MCKYCNYDLPLHYLLNNAPLLEEQRYLNAIPSNDSTESSSESVFTEIQSIEVSATEDVVSSLEILDTSFNRELKGDREYRGMLASGEALPDWIDLDSETGRLTFEAGSEDIGDRQILIQVEDKLGQVASVLLDLVVASQREETLLIDDEPSTEIAVGKGNSNEVQEVAVPQIAIADTQITDSSVGREVIFTVTLNTPSDQKITVDYATADDTAKAGSDYIAIDGTVTFEPGETEQTITVNTTGTSYLDPDRDLFLNLSNPKRATIKDSQGTGTILPAYAGIRGGSHKQDTVTFSFFDEDIFGQGGYDGSNRESNAKEPSEVVKANYRQIFKDLNTFVDREFVEVDESESEQGDIRIVVSDAPDYAYAGGHIHLAGWAAASDAGTNGWESPQGIYAYSALMHELGHAIGMPHSFGKETSVFDPEESDANTVMSYTSPGAKAATFMSYDIKSLQERYGAAEYRGGDTVYEFVTVDNYLVDGEIAIDTTRLLKQTIWDSGGTDTFDFSGLEKDSGYRFDLNQSKYQTTQSGYEGASYDRNGTTYYVPDYGTSIAIDVEIENLINSSSDDLVIANPTANIFSGYAPGLTTGDDVFIGTDELDTLDLSKFSDSDIAETIEEADLKYELGEGNSVTIKNYFNTPKDKRMKVLLKKTGSSVEEEASKLTNSIAQISKASSDRPAITITNNDALPNISIKDAGVLSSIPVRNEEDEIENSTGLLFEITLDTPSDRTVKVDYATEDGTAIANEDYSAKNETLTFQPGETIKNVFIGVTLDETKQRLEPHVADEELNLTLSNAKNATITDDRAVGTIEETRSLSVSDLEISEDGTEALFTVSLDKPSVQGVFVSYATEDGTAKAGADYTKTEGRLFIKAGESSGTVSVPIVDNKITETNETFYLNLTKPKYVLLESDLAKATILNDDPISTFNPGGIDRNLQPWAKPDAAIANNEQKVKKWLDNSQQELDLVQTSDISRLEITEADRSFDSERHHLYVMDESDRQITNNSKTKYNYEGELFAVLDSLDDLTGDMTSEAKPVYGFLIEDTDAQLLTMDVNERDYIIDNSDDYQSQTKIEAIATIPVYRLLFTSDRQELDYIQNNLSNFNLENNSEPIFYALEV